MTRVRRFFTNILKRLYKKVKFIRDNVFGIYYVLYGKRQKKPYQTFRKGLDRFPENYILNKQLAQLEMERRDWQGSIRLWKKVYSLTKKHQSNVYLMYAEALGENNENKKSLNILKAGNAHYPHNQQIIRELIDLAAEQQDWKNTVSYMEDYVKVLQNSHIAFDDYMLLANAYKELGHYELVEDTLERALEKYPHQDMNIQKYRIDMLIDKKDWNTAIERTEKLLDMGQDFEYEIKLSMLQQITGDNLSSKRTFENALTQHEEIVRKDDKNYRKMIVYDNGDSRIELYKKLTLTDSVMVTFDSINMEWQNPSFAFKLLMRQNLDIIAIRKRQTKTYQQDLTQAAFVETVSPLVKGYKDKMSYGFSLGAYNALYFASLLNCRILAYSPRLSIHPEFGRVKIIPKFEMKHELTHPYNEDISPIIVYDPQNKLDHKYIQNSVLNSFPQAHIVKIPYGGHGIAPHLLKMGVLKEFLIKFINGDIPKYNRKLKVKSHIYFNNLGKNCLLHNKLEWALDLSERALDISPNDEQAEKLKKKVLEQLEITQG